MNKNFKTILKTIVYVMMFSINIVYIKNSNANQDCFGVICSFTVCPDGGAQAPYTDSCCSCNPKRFDYNTGTNLAQKQKCAKVICAQNLCSDSMPRSLYQNDCCSCDPKRHE